MSSYVNKENAERLEWLYTEDLNMLFRMIDNFVADAEEAGVPHEQLRKMLNEKIDNFLTLHGV
jgi:DNA-binding transcriptional regulator YhcF (GntR family)